MQFVSIIIPFVNWFVISFFGRKIGKSGVIFFTIFNMVMLILVNLYCCYLAVVINTAYYINCGAWIKAGLFVVYWEFVFDLLSSLMLLMVGIISALVHVYSFSYMKNDPHFNRFISYLSLFSFFMFILISANNLIIFFFGWEGVGICSYLIINFWFTRIQANKAALKALLMNRIGDIGFIIGISLVFFCYKTVDFSVLEAVAGTAVSYGVRTVNCFGIVHLTLIDVICFFFLLGLWVSQPKLGFTRDYRPLWKDQPQFRH